MNIISTITLSKTIHKDINASIIPVLLTKLKTKTLFEYVSRFIPIPKHYNTLLNTIQSKLNQNTLTQNTLNQSILNQSILNQSILNQSILNKLIPYTNFL